MGKLKTHLVQYKTVKTQLNRVFTVKSESSKGVLSALAHHVKSNEGISDPNQIFIQRMETVSDDMLDTVEIWAFASAQPTASSNLELATNQPVLN